jgi:predicted DNA-binding transcriptional regulator AlpA
MPAGEFRGFGEAVHLRRELGMRGQLSPDSVGMHSAKTINGAAFCRTSIVKVASDLEVSMKFRRHSLRHEAQLNGHAQLSLAIGDELIAFPAEAAGPRCSRNGNKRVTALDEILWMRDVVQLTGKHRCTIHRWMHRGMFPRKNAPRSRPTGWLRSTIERWLMGTSSTPGPGTSHNAPLR